MVVSLLATTGAPVSSIGKSVCGLVVRIAGFHPAGPGSIPGSRIFARNFISSSWSDKWAEEGLRRI